MNDESTPKGASESATTDLSIPQSSPDAAVLLSRLEDLLDKVLRSLDVLASAL